MDTFQGSNFVTLILVYLHNKTDRLVARSVQLWIPSAEPPGEHRYENLDRYHCEQLEPDQTVQTSNMKKNKFTERNWVLGVCSYGYVSLSHLGNTIMRIERTTTKLIIQLSLKDRTHGAPDTRRKHHYERLNKHTLSKPPRQHLIWNE